MCITFGAPASSGFSKPLQPLFWNFLAVEHDASVCTDLNDLAFKQEDTEEVAVKVCDFWPVLTRIPYPLEHVGLCGWRRTAKELMEVFMDYQQSAAAQDLQFELETMPGSTGMPRTILPGNDVQMELLHRISCILLCAYLSSHVYNCMLDLTSNNSVSEYQICD